MWFSASIVNFLVLPLIPFILIKLGIPSSVIEQIHTAAPWFCQTVTEPESLWRPKINEIIRKTCGFHLLSLGREDLTLSRVLGETFYLVWSLCSLITCESNGSFGFLQGLNHFCTVPQIKNIFRVRHSVNVNIEKINIFSDWIFLMEPSI